MSYVKVSIQGTLVGGEKWSINPCFDPSFEFGDTVNQSNLDAATLAIANLNPGSQLLVYLSAQGSVTGARAEVRHSDTDALIGISVQNRTSPLPGTGAATKPAQTAAVYSIRTNTPGGSGRGRLYWPALGAAIDTTLRFNAGPQDSALDDMKTYLLAMRSALATNFPTIGFDLAVRSRTTRQTPHAVRIQCGNVPDVQRRRRDALPESYISRTFP